MRSKKYLLVSLLWVSGLFACPLGLMDPGSLTGKVDEADKDKDQERSSLPQLIESPSGWGVEGGAGSLADPNVNVDGVGVDAEGNLALVQSTRHSDYMWLADPSNGGGVVSKFDTKTGKEIARYRSVTKTYCAEGEDKPEQGGCTGRHSFDPMTSNFSPSRTAIDAYGNAWVANRGGQGYVTKIASEKEFCRNGGANTSQVDANGFVNVVPDDDCVLFTTKVCSGSGTGARALAVSKGQEGSAGDIWVGCWTDRTVVQLNALNGQKEGAPIGVGIQPYGAIVDGKQNMWLSDYFVNNRVQGTNYQGSVIQGVDTKTKKVIGPAQGIYATIPGCNSYGLAIDGDNRVWIAGVHHGGAVACAYDHYATDGPRWRRCSIQSGANTFPSGSFTAGRGITVDIEGNIYMSSSGNGSLIRFKWDDNGPDGSCSIVPIAEKNTVDLGIGKTLLGVGFDSAGNPWTVAMGNQAARVNLKDGSILKTQLAKSATSYNPSYYTYSDFTGYQLRNFTAPRGIYRRIIEGCSLYSSWKSLSWEAEVPEGTRLSFYVRVANTREELPLAHRHGPYEQSPADLSEVPKSTFMQLEFILESSADRERSPTLRSYKIEWACERPIG